MVLEWFLAWTLLMHVQLSVCTQGGCKPHAQLKPTERVIATVPTEADCLRLQLRTQQRLNELRKQRPVTHKGEQHLEGRSTLRCAPAPVKEG